MQITKNRPPYLGSLLWSDLIAITNCPPGTEAKISNLGNQAMTFDGTRWFPTAGRLGLVTFNQQNSFSGTTARQTMRSFTLLGNMLAPDRNLEVECYFKMTNNANAKNIIFSVGGTQLNTLGYTTVPNAFIKFSVRGRMTGIVNASIMGTGGTSAGITDFGFQDLSNDMTVDQTVKVDLQLANSADSVTAMGFCAYVNF